MWAPNKLLCNVLQRPTHIASTFTSKRRFMHTHTRTHKNPYIKHTFQEKTQAATVQLRAHLLNTHRFKSEEAKIPFILWFSIHSADKIYLGKVNYAFCCSRCSFFCIFIATIDFCLLCLKKYVKINLRHFFNKHSCPVMTSSTEYYKMNHKLFC